MSTTHPHNPENAEFEIRKAYNVVTECSLPHFWQNRKIEGVEPNEPLEMYRRAYHRLRLGDRLAAERWARAAKHLARAFWSEAKIAYLEVHSTDLPFLEGEANDAYNLHERSDTTADLLNSVATHIPPGLERMPQQMSHYLQRGRRHLSEIESKGATHELMRAERIKAAHEYGRVLEIMALAYEAENARRRDQTQAAS